MSRFERAEAFCAWFQERCADRIEPFEYGRAFFNSSFPVVWDLNLMNVEMPGASSAALIHIADRLQGGAGLEHRKIRVSAVKEGERLAPGFDAAGWEASRIVIMSHAREPDRRPAPGTASEVTSAELQRFRAETTRRSPHATSAEVVRQLVDKNRVFAAAGNGRYFAARRDGAIVSGCDLYSDGTIAQIEDVETLEEARGRGLARAVVLAALDAAVAAGNEFVFLLADDADWPKGLYERLGFVPAGHRHEFLRVPS